MGRTLTVRQAWNAVYRGLRAADTARVGTDDGERSDRTRLKLAWFAFDALGLKMLPRGGIDTGALGQAIAAGKARERAADRSQVKNMSAGLGYRRTAVCSLGRARACRGDKSLFMLIQAMTTRPPGSRKPQPRPLEIIQTWKDFKGVRR